MGKKRYARCIKTGFYLFEDNVVDLEVGKAYEVVEPHPLDSDDEIRIIDESGEDYLYPLDWFEPVEDEEGAE